VLIWKKGLEKVTF